MVPSDSQPGSPRSISAKFYFWTIRNQDHLTRGITINMWSAVSAVLIIALVDFVSLEMALHIIFVGGAATAALIWTLIERRRSWLLSISDPELKAEAHRTMIDYLAKRTSNGSHCRGHMGRSDVHPMIQGGCRDYSSRNEKQ